MLAARSWVHSDLQGRRSDPAQGTGATAKLLQAQDALSAGSFDTSITWGACARQGPRATMEDRHVGLICLPHCAAFFGVFDGHSGSRAAEFAHHHLAQLVLEQPAFPSGLPATLRTAYLEADAQLHQQLPARDMSGCTALVAMILGKQLVVANAGDSRAVLSCSGHAIDLTLDHKPTAPAEKARVLAAGGAICGNTSYDTYLCGSGCRRQSSGKWASSSSAGFDAQHLGVTRALGNFQLTTLKHRAKDNRLWEGPLTAEPEIHEHLLGPQDEFLVMATDGLWDVMSSKAAIDLVRLQLRIHNNPTRAAEKLVEMAQGWHTKDNVTVLIVQLCASLPSIELNPSRPGSCAGNRLRSGV